MRSVTQEDSAPARPIDRDEHLCARCARHMRTCCQTSEIHLTPGDVERISAHIERSDFFAFRAPENPAYADQDDDPIWRERVFRPDGTRRVLDRKPDGDCTFLGPVGCTLDLETRPLVCRLYPFDYTADGIRDELSRGCPTQLLASGQGLLDAIGMDIADARRWHEQLYRELDP